MISKNRSIKQLGYALATNVVRNLTGSCVVLLYHRVCNLDNDHLLLSVTPDNFFEQIDYLKKHYKILKAEEFKDIIAQKKKFPPRSLLITFDDGYADNYFNALPILESLNVEALFFIATGFIERQDEFWWDKLDNIIIRNGPSLKEINFNGRNIHIRSSKDGMNAFDSVFPILRNTNVTDRNKVIEEWAKRANINFERAEYRPMTWHELKRFSESASVVVGGHTVDHPSLGHRSIQEQRAEIEISKSELEHHLSKKVLYFSYPFGQAYDFTQETINICKEVGYEIVFANFPSQITMLSRRYCLPRFIVRDWQLSEFKKQVSFFFK